MVNELVNKGNTCREILLISCGLAVVMLSDSASAYLGPGAGLGMIGSLIAIIVVAIVIVLGLVIYPVRILRRRRLQARPNDDRSSTADHP